MPHFRDVALLQALIKILKEIIRQNIRDIFNLRKHYAFGDFFYHVAEHTKIYAVDSFMEQQIRREDILREYGSVKMEEATELTLLYRFLWSKAVKCDILLL